MTPMLGIMASQISGHLTAYSYDSIATVTVGGGGTTTITFSSIPSTYTHLQIRGFMMNGNYATLRFNGDTTAANYANHYLTGNGAAASSAYNASAAYVPMSGSGGTTNPYVFVTDILDYANTNKFKTVRSLEGYDANGSGSVYLSSNLWRSSSAVTSIVLTAASTINQYSSFALYGIK